MKRKILSMFMASLCFVGIQTASAEFKDIKIDLTNLGKGTLLTPEEVTGKASFTIGIAIQDDGTPVRVDKDDTTAAIVISGKYHSEEHGLGNFSSTVSVDGPVKFSMGTCNWGSTATVKDGNNTLLSFSTGNGTCYHNDKNANIVSEIYKGGAATLTFAGGGYTPYIAIEKVDPSELVEDATITYSFGDYTEAGADLPATGKIEIGKTFTIPVNRTLYLDGKTLVGWTDGTANYEIGDIVTVKGDMTLTPRFVDNTVTLADRTEETTIRWDFQQKNGAPILAYEGRAGIYVSQAKIGTETIDVKLDFTTSPSKIANANWQDWAQINNGTTFMVPSCKGAVISVESRGDPTGTTVDGVEIEGKSFTVASAAETVPLVIGAGSYYRWIQTVLPVVKTPSGETFTDADAEVVWAFNSASYKEDVTATPANGFSVTAFDQNGLTYIGTTSTTMCPDITFVRIKSVNGPSDVVKWCVKPTKGLTFTPTSLSFYISRNGTDGDLNAVTIKGEVPGGASEVFGSITPHRNNKTKEEDKFGNDPSYTIKYTYTLTEAQQQALTSGEGFNLVLNNGYGNSKDCMYSDVRIAGKLNGTIIEVPKYTLSAKADPAEGARITIYPSLDEYDMDSEVTLTAEKNFGYEFINWTDAQGKVVSEQPKFTYTVTENTELTANLRGLSTYELKLGVDGGANSYQVQASPAPTMVDDKMMYEEGTKVTLTAISNPIVTFTNWNDGQSSSEIEITMDGDKEYTGVFSAIDYVVGWDFYKRGGNGRPADFYAADNDAVALVLRNESGQTSGWLDKSQEAAGGYEGRPGAVNWRTTGLGEYYWQTTVNAEAFTDLAVTGAMVFNYNAYTTYRVEASLDESEWDLIGNVVMAGAKNWTDYTFTLPEKYNNQKAVSLRWIADKTSQKDGTESANDGICLGATYITGTAKLLDDGVAPVLVSTVPAEGTDNASINGKIVLSFDEKVKVAPNTVATLGDVRLEPTVSGKTVMFPYNNLDYGTSYTFTLPAKSVMDLTDNAIDKPITISFATRTRPAVEKESFSFIVPTDGTLEEAINTANNRSDKTKRFRIFILNGEYKLPASKDATKTGSDGKAYPDPTTYIKAPNISFIGESREGVIITNTLPEVGVKGEHEATANPLEGIGKGDVFRIEKTATNTYFQHLTIKSSMGDKRGRDIEVNDNSNKTIMKDVCLWGYQDTYVSNNDNGRFYFEGGVLRGRTDFLCGKGDVYYNGVTLRMVGHGYLAVPSVPRQYGYIFKDCEIVGEKDKADGNKEPDGNYTLGRPWGKGTPIAIYIDTKMTIKPSATGWSEMGDGWPARFAEYNSTTATGTVIDLKDRKKIFGDNKANNPVLTRDEAETYTLARVMGGDDNWDPSAIAEQAPAPTNVKNDGSMLTWDDNKYTLLWAVCADGKVIDFTTEPSYSLASPAVMEKAARTDIVYSVRAANEMGGLSEAVTATATSAISDIDADEEVVSTVYYNVQGIQVKANTPGVLLKVDTLASGRTVTTKVVVK